MVKNSGFIFFLLLNTNQMPLIKNIQILSQQIGIIDKGLKKVYLK